MLLESALMAPFGLMSSVPLVPLSEKRATGRGTSGNRNKIHTVIRKPGLQAFLLNNSIAFHFKFGDS